MTWKRKDLRGTYKQPHRTYEEVTENTGGEFFTAAQSKITIDGSHNLKHEGLQLNIMKNFPCQNSWMFERSPDGDFPSSPALNTQLAVSQAARAECSVDSALNTQIRNTLKFLPVIATLCAVQGDVIKGFAERVVY